MSVPSSFPPSRLERKKEYFSESFHPSNLICVTETFHPNRTLLRPQLLNIWFMLSTLICLPEKKGRCTILCLFSLAEARRI